MADRDTVPPPLLPDAAEADALAQAEEVEPLPGPARPDTGFEVPEADAWEQSQEVPVDEPDRP
jgi:hypothetical protein